MSDEEQLLKKIEDLKAKRRKRSNWRRNRQRDRAKCHRNRFFDRGEKTVKYDPPNLVPRTPMID